jgi:uncharacterized membrane protein YcaP (DUF421 family)
MAEDWLLTTWTHAGLVLLSAGIIYATVIALNRLNGLRSFAKMSSFDFAMTIAVGTLLASALAASDPPVARAMVGLGALFGLQYGVAQLRMLSPRFKQAVDNRPLLLMRDGEMLVENMRRARISETDLWSQLRSANVMQPAHVSAVVLETTGDVSVLHRAGSDVPFDPRLLTGVRDG